MSAFLGVETSLTGRCWTGPNAETSRRAEALAQTYDLDPAVCQILARLDVAPENVENYLDPKLRDLLPDPRDIKDMERAARRLLKAVLDREKIAIFADYDVDGGASAALLLHWLKTFEHSATLYVPDRIDEGYGPNVPSMTALARDHDLIICVDCGTLSHDALAAADAADVIVLDHHLGGETLPPALAVVNPNRQDETRMLSHLCAAAVVFLVLVEAGRCARQSGMSPPDLIGLTDLVALATVADVAPLTGVNRAFVRTGLKVMSQRRRPGLVALADVARLDTAPNSYHLGYVLGPRINAGGRVGRADLGARLLASNAIDEANTLAQTLELLNTERREIEKLVREEALAQAEARGSKASVAWAAGEGWHPGVVGIVASRVKETMNRPAVVIGFDGDLGKGSGRSVPGVDLGMAIQRLVTEGLLEKGGGHKMA
ncbi:MAG: DHH family phosphoesterase, partial [Pseudomonadota bacterium]